jgi:hypothetical protein
LQWITKKHDILRLTAADSTGISGFFGYFERISDVIATVIAIETNKKVIKITRKNRLIIRKYEKTYCN